MKDYTIVQMQKGERKRCRKWRIDLKDGRYPSGKQKYKSKKFEGTYTQAVALAEELSADRSRLKSRWTVEDYFMHINATKLATGQIRQRTYDTNLTLMRHVFEWIGNMSVSEVRPSDIEKIYVRLRTTPTPRGDGWSGTSVNNLSKVLHNLFEHARRERLVSSNPVEDAIAPKKDTKEREAMGFAESVAFEAKLDPTERHQLAVIIQLETGLRIGEVCGLRWSDIEGGYVHVRRSMQKDAKPGELKTSSSKRMIPVSENLAAALAVAPRRCEWVIGSELGNPLTPSNACGWWSKYRDSFGLPGWTLHQFRHQFATNLARQGISPKTMATLLGHTSPVISLDIYTHVEKEQTAEAIAQLQAAKERAAQPSAPQHASGPQDKATEPGLVKPIKIVAA